MLNFLTIKDFALIEHSEVEFGTAFNVITGESGAGKSILMGALAFLLGGRADRGVVRAGARQAMCAASFTVPEEMRRELGERLEDSGIPFDPCGGEITFRRTVSAAATRNFINDVPVGAKLLAEFGSELVDFHAAGDQLSLVSPARQLDLLDRYAGVAAEKAKCRDLAAEITALEEERRRFNSGLPTAAEAEHLRSVMEEIDIAGTFPGEDEELNSKFKLASNARLVIESSSALTELLTEGEDSVADRLGEAYHRLRELGRVDEDLAAGLLESCSTLQDDLARFSQQVGALADQVEMDGAALSAMESRLEVLYTLKRRYGPSLEQVIDTRNAAAARVADFEKAAEKLAFFEEKALSLRQELRQAAEDLSARRREAAGKFLDAAAKILSALGFADGRFDTAFETVEPGANGMDRIEILFSANPGEDLRPLRRIASSGELSRLMLAIKTVLADADSVPTVVFDEIDMNIGGETANRVGEELSRLGRHRQIISISHLAQVAARADSHFAAVKSNAGGRSVSRTEKLTDPALRAAELARMLGGGSEALAHAKALLAQTAEK